MFDIYFVQFTNLNNEIIKLVFSTNIKNNYIENIERIFPISILYDSDIIAVYDVEKNESRYIKNRGTYDGFIKPNSCLFEQLCHNSEYYIGINYGTNINKLYDKLSFRPITELVLKNYILFQPFDGNNVDYLTTLYGV